MSVSVSGNYGDGLVAPDGLAIGSQLQGRSTLGIAHRTSHPERAPVQTRKGQKAYAPICI